MNLAHFQNLVEKITYKDWKIQLRRELYSDYIVLRISHLAADAYKKDFHAKKKSIVLSHWTFCPEQLRAMDDEQFIGMVWHQILTLEKHESEEWFRFQGKLVHNPHPERRKNGKSVP